MALPFLVAARRPGWGWWPGGQPLFSFLLIRTLQSETVRCQHGNQESFEEFQATFRERIARTIRRSINPVTGTPPPRYAATSDADLDVIADAVTR